MDEKRLSSYIIREEKKRAAPDRLLFRFPNFGRKHLTLALAGPQQKAAGKVKFAASGARMSRDTLCHERKAMDMTTLLIIVIIVLLLGGGGFYGRGRWW